ncbi:MAG: hypothetical protein NVS9B10_10200 [Nevskia sp.]
MIALALVFTGTGSNSTSESKVWAELPSLPPPQAASNSVEDTTGSSQAAGLRINIQSFSRSPGTESLDDLWKAAAAPRAFLIYLEESEVITV